MNFLLDTHLLVWIPVGDARISAPAQRLLSDPANHFLFSVASLWEIAIKRSTGKLDRNIDPKVIRRQLLQNGYQEMPVLGQHALTVELLPWIHRDPFDRLLVAQATVEGITLLTADTTVARYPGPIRRV